MAEWRSEQHRRDHYRLHRWEYPGASLDEYDASAQAILDIGTYFEFFDDDSERWRTGCYHRETARLTVLDEDDKIVSHFHCPERYVRNLLHSNYE